MKAAMILAVSILTTLPVFAQKQDDRLQPSCGDRRVEFEVKTTKSGTDTNLELGKSQIYVVEVAKRAFLFDARKITIRIGIDGQWVGAVKGTNTYMTVAVSPGEHHVCAERQSVQASLEREAGFISFTAEPNKRYYFRASFTEHAGVNLDRLKDDEGRSFVSSSKPTKATPSER